MNSFKTNFINFSFTKFKTQNSKSKSILSNSCEEKFRLGSSNKYKL